MVNDWSGGWHDDANGDAMLGRDGMLIKTDKGGQLRLLHGRYWWRDCLGGRFTISLLTDVVILGRSVISTPRSKGADAAR